MPYKLDYRQNEDGEWENVWVDDPEFLSRLGNEARKGVDWFKGVVRDELAPLERLKEMFTGPTTTHFYVDENRLRELQGLFGVIPRPRGTSIMDMMSERYKGGVPFPEGELGQMERDLMLGRGLRAPGKPPHNKLIDEMYQRLPKRGE